MASPNLDAEDACSSAVAQLTSIPSGDVLVVTHGAVLQSLVPVLAPGGRVAPGYPNCGITTITIEAGVAALGGLGPACSPPEYADRIRLP